VLLLSAHGLCVLPILKFIGAVVADVLSLIALAILTADSSWILARLGNCLSVVSLVAEVIASLDTFIALKIVSIINVASCVGKGYKHQVAHGVGDHSFQHLKIYLSINY
jgi:hypothetical protein